MYCDFTTVNKLLNAREIDIRNHTIKPRSINTTPITLVLRYPVRTTHNRQQSQYVV